MKPWRVMRRRTQRTPSSGRFSRWRTPWWIFVTTGELDIRNLVDSIIADFARLVIRQAILGPLSQALGGALGGLFPGGGIGGGLPGAGGFSNSIAGAPVFGVGHTGAVVPHWPEYRAVDPGPARRRPPLPQRLRPGAGREPGHF